MMAQDLWNAKRLHPDAALKRTNQFRLKEEGRIVSQDPEVRVKHKTCSTICGTHVQVISPKVMTELASGSKKVIIWPRMGLAYQNLELKLTPMTPQHTIDLSPFPGSLTHLGASRRLRGHKYIKARPILGHILTFFDPPCQPGPIFLVQNSLYRCPTYSTTCFMLNLHLWGVF